MSLCCRRIKVIKRKREERVSLEKVDHFNHLKWDELQRFRQKVKSGKIKLAVTTDKKIKGKKVKRNKVANEHELIPVTTMTTHARSKTTLVDCDRQRIDSRLQSLHSSPLKSTKLMSRRDKLLQVVNEESNQESSRFSDQMMSPGGRLGFMNTN